MSDPKRGGSRDISELKQRLGLKKATTPAGAPGARANGAAGGVLPPPGMAPPPPPQPVIPNAADDPFAAMNAMAAVGTVQRAPEIVIVNDGKPVENVGATSRGGTIVKLVAPAVVALILGVVIGQIAKGANVYNAGLKDARTILGDPQSGSSVKYLKKTLAEIDGVLDEMKTKNNYRPDTAADKKLRDYSARLEVKPDKVYRTGTIDPDLNVSVMTFYGGAAEVKGMLDSHVKAAANDDLALSTARTASAAAAVKDTENATLASAGAVRYGALIQAPTDTDRGADFGVRLVELGQPYCGAALATNGKCDNGESPSAFAYRGEPSGGWTKGDLQAQGSDSVPAKKLLLLLPSGTRDALIKGNEPGASEVFYVKRLRALSDRIKKLIDEANKLEQRLQAESNKGSRFSFFL
ncbi:MAG TPA: hypothetical protein VGD37_28730 [Kofleriaceae bacterium]